MQINECMNILKQNYKLEKSMIDFVIDSIIENGISDFSLFLSSIAKSKKFDFLSKLQDAIDKRKVVVELDEIEASRVYSYADKLFSKTTSVFDEIDYQVSIGKDLNSDTMTRFIYANFDDKDRQVLKLIGDRNRLLFMIRGMREALREQIKQNVEKLSLEKKKSVLAIPMAQRSDNENRMLSLMQKGIK